MLICPSDIQVPTNMSVDYADVFWVEPVVIDNSGANLTATPSNLSGSTFPLHETVVSYTVMDSAGNVANCSFIVTVVGMFNTVYIFVLLLTILNSYFEM